jgi:hypothetical protein
MLKKKKKNLSRNKNFKLISSMGQEHIEIEK